jgi:uncharacterized protein YoxC
MLEISFIILSIAFLLLAGSLAAIFYQLCKILQRLHPTIDQMNLRLPGILRNLEDVAENVKDVSSQVHLQVTNLTRLLSRVQAGLEVISVMEGKLRKVLSPPVLGRARNLGALWKGVSVFARTFASGSGKVEKS